MFEKNEHDVKENGKQKMLINFNFFYFYPQLSFEKIWTKKKNLFNFI